MKSEPHTVVKLNIIVSLDLAINARAFTKEVLSRSLSFHFKSETKKRWEQRAKWQVHQVSYI